MLTGSQVRQFAGDWLRTWNWPDLDAIVSHYGLEVQAHKMDRMAGVREGLGLYPTSESLASRPLELRRPILGPDNPATLKTTAMLQSEELKLREPAVRKHFSRRWGERPDLRQPYFLKRSV